MPKDKANEAQDPEPDAAVEDAAELEEAEEPAGEDPAPEPESTDTNGADPAIDPDLAAAQPEPEEEEPGWETHRVSETLEAAPAKTDPPPSPEVGLEASMTSTEPEGSSPPETPHPQRRPPMFKRDSTRRRRMVGRPSR